MDGREGRSKGGKEETFTIQLEKQGIHFGRYRTENIQRRRGS